MKKAVLFLGFVLVTSLLISSCSSTSKPSECACQKAMYSATGSSPDWTTINNCAKAYKDENSCVKKEWDDANRYGDSPANFAIRSMNCFNCN
tara:strand:+ start:1598 stop:1873 length:276 start_codon:yes stop_codon:yes gene_type:complete